MKKNPITCTRRLEFDAAHRVLRHESRCKYLHGHRYVVEATFEAQVLDKVGRIVDFGVVKERLGGWLDREWDHNAILSEQDRKLGEAVAELTHQRIFYLPENPTAENMAAYLLSQVCPELFTDCGIRCVRIRIYETPNCYAEAAERAG